MQPGVLWILPTTPVFGSAVVGSATERIGLGFASAKVLAAQFGAYTCLLASHTNHPPWITGLQAIELRHTVDPITLGLGGVGARSDFLRPRAKHLPCLCV